MAGRERLERVASLLAHLRLHYQLLLAPVFLWGFYLGRTRPEAELSSLTPARDLLAPTPLEPRAVWLAFLAFHIFLYGGATAFNSYYDRDRGPVGGMRNPPPVSEALLPFSVAIQAIGILLAAAVNPTFLAIYLVMMAMGIAYSHPSVRLKARPVVGLATVALGQGVLASLGGWASAKPDLGSIDPIGWVGILAATLVTVGFYPITQAYQIEDDRARGDITFAVWAGPRRTFGFAVGVQALGAVLLAVTIAARLDLARAILVAGFYTTLLAVTALRARVFPQLGVLEQYRRVMALNSVMSGGFLIFVTTHLLLLG